MDQESQKDNSQKKSEMIIISPQELVQLGLLKKLPTDANTDAPSTSSTETENAGASTVPNIPQPLVLNHVLKIKNPLINIRRVIARRPQSQSNVTVNPNVTFKKKIIIARKPTILSKLKNASTLKNILLTSAETNKQKETSSSDKTTVIIQRKGIYKKAIRSHGIIKTPYTKNFLNPRTTTKKTYRKRKVVESDANSTISENGSNASAVNSCKCSNASADNISVYSNVSAENSSNVSVENTSDCSVPAENSSVSAENSSNGSDANSASTEDEIQLIRRTDFLFIPTLASNVTSMPNIPIEHRCMMHTDLINSPEEPVAGSSKVTLEKYDFPKTVSADNIREALTLNKPIKIHSDAPIKVPVEVVRNLITGQLTNFNPEVLVQNTDEEVKQKMKQKASVENTQKVDTGMTYISYAEALKQQEILNENSRLKYEEFKKQAGSNRQVFRIVGLPDDFMSRLLAAQPGEKVWCVPKTEGIPDIPEVLDKQDDDPAAAPMKKRSRKDPIIMKLDDQFESVETEVLISDSGENKVKIQEKKKSVEKKKEKGNRKIFDADELEGGQLFYMMKEKVEFFKINKKDSAAASGETSHLESTSEKIEETTNVEAKDVKESKDQAVRKKGRPRKKPVKSTDDRKEVPEVETRNDQENDNGRGEISSDSLGLEENTCEGDPKKVEENKESTIDESTTKVEVKKKGRPKKIRPIETVETSADVPVVQKKRGRPRKYPLPENTDTLSPIMETSLDTFEEKMKVLNSELEPISDKSSSSDTSPKTLSVEQQILTDSPIQTPIKKRGRKKKSEKLQEEYDNALTADDLESLTKAGVFEEVEIEVSKSGRKRKKINYFDMENNFMEEAMDEKRPKKQKISQSFTVEQQEKEKLKSEKLKAKIRSEEVFSSSSTEEESVEQEDVENKQEESNEDGKGNKKEEDKSEIKEETEVMEMQEEKATSSNKGKTEEGAGKKYNYTGETTKMMKSIFSAAFKGSVGKDNPDADSSQGDKSVLVRRGRKRNDDVNALIDEQDKVTCTACKNKILCQNWPSHNRNIHYNLSWREGENFLNIDDELFLKRTLKPILQEDKKLICYKCSESFVTVTDFIVHKEECEGVVLGGQVTCAICEEQMEKTKWAFHKRRKHNNLSWRNGDPPLDLGNQSLVLEILNNLYKAKVPLYCYKCNTSKKSVVGFLSHQAQCGLNQEEVKIQCPHCQKKILPVSLQCHIKMVHTKKKEPVVKPPKIVVVKEDSPGKRKAAKNALAIIDSLSKHPPVYERHKYFCNHLDFKDNLSIRRLLKKELEAQNNILCKFDNCQVKCDNVPQFWNHVNVCQFKVLEYYVCMKCCAICLTEETVKNHLEKEHNINVLTDDNATSEEDEGVEQELKYRQTLYRKRRFENLKVVVNKNTKLKPRFISNLAPHSIKKLFQCAFEYTLEFCNEHFTQSVLFDSLRYLQSEWNLLEEHLLSNYLPKNEESCDVSRIRVRDFENVLGVEHKFKKFDLFEVEQQKGGTMTIFCGGPISAMAWLPTPHILLRCTQILAVAVLNDFDSKYLVNSNYNEHSVIQFWDCGILKNRIRPIEPELLFCLAVDYGPIWHLEWCPSGCYDENLPSNRNQKQRMGLLAVAGSSPDVCIYSVPFLEEQEKGLVYKNKPLLKLKMAVSPDNLKKKYYPTKISWSKASRHKYVAVGYTDGMVAIFNLETTSTIMRFKDRDGVEAVLPCKTIKAHTHYISVLSLIHHGGGARWLLTGSFDSNAFLWDLTNNTKAIYTRKKIISDGTWLTNWVAYVTTLDESNTRNLMINAGVISHRNYLYEPTYITNSPTTFTTVSSSDWLNGVINGNGEGEILASFLPQLIYSLDNYKRIKNHRFCMGYANLIDKHKSPEERVTTELEKQKSLKPIIKSIKNPDVDSSAFLFSKSKDFSNEYEPLTYKEVKEMCALVFCDMVLNNFDDFPEEKQDKLSPNSSTLQISRPNLYPLKKINKICFNPNCQASLYYATGYQAGFVRLSYVKFLENDKQVV